MCWYEKNINDGLNYTGQQEKRMRLASDPTASLQQRQDDILNPTAQQEKRLRLTCRPDELTREREYRAANHWLDDTFGVDRSRY